MIRIAFFVATVFFISAIFSIAKSQTDCPQDPCACPGVDCDVDGISYALDNCQGAYNTGQDDIDGDDCGNLCDCDYDQSGTCGFSDFLQFAGAFGTTDEEKCHVETIAGCTVGFADFLFMAANFGKVPGPSGSTAGTTACP
jgi:hypothetical protein